MKNIIILLLLIVNFSSCTKSTYREYSDDINIPIKVQEQANSICKSTLLDSSSIFEIITKKDTYYFIKNSQTKAVFYKSFNNQVYDTLNVGFICLLSGIFSYFIYFYNI